MKYTLLTVALALTIAGAGCAPRVDFEKVPIGANVDVTRQDGGVVRGIFAARDDQNIMLTVGSTTRSFPRDHIVHVRLVDDASSSLPASATFREYSVPAGTRLALRLNSPVGSDSSRVGDPIGATLDRAVLLDGIEVLPVGSVVSGHVVAAESSGKVTGRGTLSLLFDSVSGGGQSYPIAARVDMMAESGRNRDTETIGIGTGGGALLGALLGGGKGAAIGAGVGAGAGTAVARSTRGPQVRMDRGAVLSPRLDQTVDVRVPITQR